MAEYIELYKKYRPRAFDEVIGQRTTVESIKSALKNNTIPTAYLLSGSAGTGKTTIAKILAKSLNCNHLDENGKPCNECDTCKAIDNDSQLGVKYISMANNGSADDVRNLMNEARLAQPVNKQVFILDEVQNLSGAAQDALLIGLESENQKSLFILCTTDPDKIKPAVLSRVQQRQLNKVDSKELAQHLAKICIKEGIDYKDDSNPVNRKTLAMAAIQASGSVRNAIRNLEVLINNGKLSAQEYERLMIAVHKKDVPLLYQTTTELDADGQNFVALAEILYREYTKELEHLMTGKRTRVNLTESKLFEIIDELGECINRMVNRTVDPRILLEVTLVKIIRKQ